MPLQRKLKGCLEDTSGRRTQTINILKFQTFSLSVLKKMLIIWADIDKILVRIANREDPDQTACQKQSDLGLRCLS